MKITSEKVPWICKEEWEYCKVNLFGEDLLMKKKALEHLYIWKVRCANLPIAVECTLILMDVHLRGCDQSAENEQMLTNTMNYESWYSVAIMRFLNLITDSNVGTKISSSMNQLARQYEIPEWIVEIRHAVAHGPLLPSIPSLKEAVEKCLNWLYDSYWSKNLYEDCIPNNSGTSYSATFSCLEVCLIVKKYLLLGFENMDIPISDRQKISEVLLRSPKNEMSNSFESWPLVEIYKCLLRKLKRHLKKNTDYGKNLVSSILETDQYLFSPNALQNDGISKMFFHNWSDILFVICDSSICYHFLQELANIVISPLENTWRQRCAALYLKEILKNFSKQNQMTDSIGNSNLNQNVPKKKSKIILKCQNNNRNQIVAQNNLKLTEKEILKITYTVLNTPNQLVKIFLKHLLSLSNSSKHMLNYEKLISLINIYTGNRRDADCMKIDGIHYTIQNIMKNPDLVPSNGLARMPENKIAKRNYLRVEKTNINEENEWKNSPLGILPWQTVFQPWLHIYDSE